ncbi:MAG TPA: YceI family protein [Gemmatimonadaceae bacterium]
MIRRSLFALMLVVSSVGVVGAQAPAQAGLQTWNIDANHSAAQFAVRHLLVSTVRGQFDKLSGSIKINGNDIRSLVVDVTIDAASVNTRVANRDNDLRSPSFFDVEKFPTITFVSKKSEPVDAGHFKVTGDLTMHGVTKEVVLDVEGPTPPITQGTTQRVGATATTKINRRDFGLNYSRVVEGTAVVGDEITITIDIEAVRRTN